MEQNSLEAIMSCPEQLKNADARGIASIWKYYCRLCSWRFEGHMLNFIFFIFYFFKQELVENDSTRNCYSLGLGPKPSNIIEGDKEGGPSPHISSLKRWLISSNGINVEAYRFFLHLTAFITHPRLTPCSHVNYFKVPLSSLAFCSFLLKPFHTLSN